MRKKTITLSIDDTVLEKARAIAKEDDRSISWLVEKLLKEFLANQDKKD